jgi:hypothetical protein
VGADPAPELSDDVSSESRVRKRNKMRITHRNRDFIMFVNARPNAGPEGDKTKHKENHDNSEFACFRSYLPES